MHEGPEGLENAKRFDGGCWHYCVSFFFLKLFLFLLKIQFLTPWKSTNFRLFILGKEMEH